jgi:ankyrin repeat protein
METSFEKSRLELSMFINKGVLDLSTVSEGVKKARKSATEAKLPKCSWKVSKHPQTYQPKRYKDTPLDALEISQLQQDQRQQRVNGIKERLMSSYFQPKAVEKLADVVRTPYMQQQIRRLRIESIHNMTRLDEVTELKAPKQLSIEEIFEKRVRRSLAQSRQILSNVQDKPEGRSIIHATLSKRNRLVEAFIDACPNDRARVETVNTIDQFGRTALQYATFLGLKQTMLMLLIAGACPRHRDVYGRTCLHYAGLTDDATVLEIILHNLKTVREIRSRASESTNSNTVAEKLKFLSFMRLADRPAQESEVQQAEDFIELRVGVDLAELGNDMKRRMAKMEYSDEIPTTPTFKGSKTDNARFIDYQDEVGRSALHFAALNGATGIVRLLLDMGANPLLEDHHRQRPLELTKSRQVTQLLVQKGNSVGAKQSLQRSRNGSPSGQ